jgi:hypothetical protein
MEIRLTERAAAMIRLAALTDPTLEVGGFGHTVLLDDSTVLVDDIIIPPHEVGSAHAEMAIDDVEALAQVLAARGEVLADWRLWWHSHAKMKAFVSSTDEPTLWELAEMFGGWAVGLVTNADGEYHGWLDVTEPFRLTLTQCAVVIERPDDEPELVEQVAEMMRGVTKRTYVPATNGAKLPILQAGFVPRKPEPQFSWMGKELADMTDEEYEEFRIWCNEDDVPSDLYHWQGRV